MLNQLGTDWRECAYMGDDLQDLAVLQRCALAMTVPEAPELVRSYAHWISPIAGGRGAVRSAAEMILQARGQWQDAVQPWQD